MKRALIIIFLLQAANVNAQTENQFFLWPRASLQKKLNWFQYDLSLQTRIQEASSFQAFIVSNYVTIKLDERPISVAGGYITGIIPPLGQFGSNLSLFQTRLECSHKLKKFDAYEKFTIDLLRVRERNTETLLIDQFRYRLLFGGTFKLSDKIAGLINEEIFVKSGDSWFNQNRFEFAVLLTLSDFVKINLGYFSRFAVNIDRTFLIEHSAILGMTVTL